MKLKFTTILESIKKMKLRDFIYPGVLIFFLLIVTIIFLFATRFISKNINNVFSYEQSDESGALNMTLYTMVAKKLNLPVMVPEKKAPPSEAGIPLNMATEAATTTEAIVKSAITITVINSTKKSGLAAELAKQLSEAGFANPKTGTGSKLYATTTILVKESKYDYAPLLLETVLKSYPFAIATATSDTADFDATIIIGTR